jgi:hypothetical protein
MGYLNRNVKRDRPRFKAYEGDMRAVARYRELAARAAPDGDPLGYGQRATEALESARANLASAGYGEMAKRLA